MTKKCFYLTLRFEALEPTVSGAIGLKEMTKFLDAADKLGKKHGFKTIMKGEPREFEVKTIRIGGSHREKIEIEPNTCYAVFEQTEEALELLRNLQLHKTISLNKKIDEKKETT